MSRVLAQIMGAAEPQLHAQLTQLERAAGLPNADIHLMMEVINGTRSKIRELGLDPHDTTGPELYQTLKARLAEDEVRVRDALSLSKGATSDDLLEAIQSHLNALSPKVRVFAVKQTVMRALLKKLQPKRTMQRLGYRSLDSMLKHEPAAQLLAATSLIESEDWQHRRLSAYKKLKAADFESRPMSFLLPNSKQWPEIAAEHVEHSRHNMVAVPELGSVVLLSIGRDLPALAITTLLLSMGSVNDMRALGSYLKLQQVRPDFGKLFADAIQHEPLIASEVTNEPLPWRVVHWFYGHGQTPFYPDAFEPHVQPEDLAWREAEDVLAELQPALEFWQGNQLLAMLDGSSPVSLNMLDVALSVCNGLDYSERIVSNMRTTLSRELLGRYLHHESLQALLTSKLDEQLAPELALE